MNQIRDFIEQPLTSVSLSEYLKSMSQISQFGENLPETGIITDFSTWICSIF